MEILASERRFPTTPDSYSAMLGNDARLYRDDVVPFLGSTAAREAIMKRPGDYKWTVEDAGVSGSLDLAYVYGTAEFKSADSSKPAEKGNYVRIWKRQQGRWRVILDLVV